MFLKGWLWGRRRFGAKPIVDSVVLPAHARTSCLEFKLYNANSDSDIHDSRLLASTNPEEFEECMLSNCIECGFVTPCF